MEIARLLKIVGGRKERVFMSDFEIDCDDGGDSECCGATIYNGICSRCHEHAEPMEDAEDAPAEEMGSRQAHPPTQQSTPCPQCVDFGVIPPLVYYCKTCGRKLPEHGAHC